MAFSFFYKGVRGGEHSEWMKLTFNISAFASVFVI